jgi:[protein-PII] uridylyltransferase
LLLHDTGKSDSHGDHAAVSGQLADRVARRLGLDGSATHVLRIVIESHLLLVSISQRRDLEDSAIIRTVAKQVQSVETLSILHIHTLADSLATSDKLWNDFKDALLWILYNKTRSMLAGGTEFVRAEEKQRELLAEEVSRSLPGKVTQEELNVHVAALPPRYFQLQSAPEITRDLVLAHRFLHLQLADEQHPFEPIVDWHNEPDRGYTVVKICTWDRAALFNHICGSFSAAGLNILSAQIFTRSDDIVFDTFFVTDADTGTMAGREEREKFEALLTKSLVGEDVDFAGLVARRKGVRPLYLSYDGDRIPTQVKFDNETSDSRSAIEVETEDRVGLLYTISLALAELDLYISAAKIVTEKGAAIDTFYVNERDGRKVMDPGRQDFVARKIRDAIGKLG